jgi:hypothetical protein
MRRVGTGNSRQETTAGGLYLRQRQSKRDMPTRAKVVAAMRAQTPARLRDGGRLSPATLIVAVYDNRGVEHIVEREITRASATLGFPRGLADADGQCARWVTSDREFGARVQLST